MRVLSRSAGWVFASLIISISIFCLSARAEHEEEEIKTMQLYKNIDRIWKDLESEGYSRSADSVIEASVVNKYDCYNYGGADGARAAS
jgi:hypothetical protein